MEKLTDYLKLSSAIYKIIARPWYLEVTNEWLKRFIPYRAVFEALAEQTGDSHLRQGASLMADIPTFIDEEEYAKKFASVFLVSNITTLKSVTPHESVYLSRSGLIKQEQWDEVFKVFVDEGIGREDFKEPEDHITSELHFLALLGEQASEFEKSGEKEKSIGKLAVRLKFLHEHTLMWTDKLLNHMKRLTDDALYLSVAYLTDGFPHADSLIIDTVVNEAVEGCL
jgi:TorA maturation chaperone TorD